MWDDFGPRCIKETRGDTSEDSPPSGGVCWDYGAGVRGAGRSSTPRGRGFAPGNGVLRRPVPLAPWLVQPVALGAVTFSPEFRKGSRGGTTERSARLRGPRPASPPSLRPGPPRPSLPLSEISRQIARPTKWSPEKDRKPDVMNSEANPLGMPAREAELEGAERSNRWPRSPGEPMGTQRPRRPNAASRFSRETRRRSLCAVVSPGPWGAGRER